MEPSPAYEFGRATGAFVVSFLLLLSFVGYTVGVWKYAKGRHAAWLALTIVLSLPMLGMIALSFIVGAISIYQHFSKPAGDAKAERKAPSEAVDLLKEKFDTVQGNNFDYTVQVPDLPAWKIDTKMGAFDKTISHRDLYIGILAERLGAGDSEVLRQLAERNLADNVTSYSVTKAKPFTIAGKQWLTFDADVVVQNMHFKYRYFVFSDSKRSIQIIAWTSPAYFSRNATLIDQIARSFQFGKD